MAHDAINEATISQINDLGLRSGRAADEIEDLGAAAAYSTAAMGGTSRSASAASRNIKKMSEGSARSARASNVYEMSTHKLASKVGSVTRELSGLSRNLLRSSDGMEVVGTFGSIISNVASKWGNIIPMVTAVGTALTATATAAHEYGSNVFKTWKSLSSIGVSFGGDIIAVGKGMTDTMTDLPSLTKAISSSSEALAAFGGTADRGAKLFIGAISQVRWQNDGMGKSALTFQEHLNSLGVGFDEHLELTSELMQNETLAFKLRNMNARELAYTTTAYITDLDALAKLTGKSRKELAKEQRANTSNAQFQAAIANFDPGKIVAVEEAMRKVGEFGPHATKVFMAALAGAFPTDKTALRFMTSSLGEAVYKIGSELKVASTSASQTLFTENINMLGIAAEQTRIAFQPFAALGGLISGEMGEIFTGTITVANRNKIALEEYGKHTGRVASITSDLATALQFMVDKARGTVRDNDGNIILNGSPATKAITDAEIFGKAAVAELKDTFFNELLVPAYTGIIKNIIKGFTDVGWKPKSIGDSAFTENVNNEILQAQKLQGKELLAAMYEGIGTDIVPLGGWDAMYGGPDGFIANNTRSKRLGDDGKPDLNKIRYDEISGSRDLVSLIAEISETPSFQTTRGGLSSRVPSKPSVSSEFDIPSMMLNVKAGKLLPAEFLSNMSSITKQLAALKADTVIQQDIGIVDKETLVNTNTALVDLKVAVDLNTGSNKPSLNPNPNQYQQNTPNSKSGVDAEYFGGSGA